MRLSSRGRVAGALAAGTLISIGCEGPQSALDPAGRDAERLAQLFFWMAGVAAAIWLVVVGLTLYAIRAQRAHSTRAANALILGGGVALPTVVLAGLLAYGLAMLPDVLALPRTDGTKIAVSGERWWWRVTYHAPDAPPVELANEIRLPVGERVLLELTSPDVIHSFWVPSLAGKIDMIPGRTNRLALEPTRTGVFRGACAEYCGTAHAHMSFYVVVMERGPFEAWLRQQREPAQPPQDALARRGRGAFLANGCGACHTVRGTFADGVIGPDLTHVGGRVSIGAGILPMEPEALRRWVAHTEAVKPGVRMPAFGMLPEEELTALASWLEGLE